MPACEAPDWPVGEYEIDQLGYEDNTHHLVVRGAKQSDPDHPDPNLVIADDLVPLFSKATGEIEYVVAHTEWDRLDAMTPVGG